MQVVMPGGGITTIDEHEVPTFGVMTGLTLPVQPVLQDNADVLPYLIVVKQDEPAGQR